MSASPAASCSSEVARGEEVTAGQIRKAVADGHRDGRRKPEVSALGVATRWAASAGVDTYGYANGTSLSTPLIGALAAVLIEAHPDWTPLKIREALCFSGSRFNNPDNAFGYGIPDLVRAIHDPRGADADGSGERRLTDSGGWPMWWPDGSRIGYQVVGADGYERLFTVSPEGGEPEPLDIFQYKTINCPFDVSPDGGRIVTSNLVPVSAEIWLLPPPVSR